MLASWNVTNRCNLQCEHCYRDAGAALDDELSTAEGKALIDSIAIAGFKLLVFSGGEPFLRDDILELTAHAKARGLRPVYGTNGTLLTRDRIKAIKKAGGAAVAISVHMLDEEQSAAFTGSKSALSRAKQAIKNCTDLGLPVQINTTVFDRNADEIPALCDFARESGAMAHHVLFMVPTGRAKNIEDEALRKQRYDTIIRTTLEKRKETGFDIKPTCAPQFVRIARELGVDISRYSRGCLAGTAYCSITPTGDVWPCPYLPLKLGTVRDTAFEEIWASNPVLRTMRSAAYTGTCGTCAFKSACGGCRARAYFYTGDYMASDEWCTLVEDAHD